MPGHRIFTMKFAKVYPLYVQKAERRNRTKEEVDRIICWLTGYDQVGLQRQIERESDFETHRVAISNERLVGIDDRHVSFRYRPPHGSATHEKKTLRHHHDDDPICIPSLTRVVGRKIGHACARLLTTN